MSSYSSLLSSSPPDWAGDAEAMAADAVSSYLSFDADVAGEYYHHHPPGEAFHHSERQATTLFDALQADVDYSVSAEAASNGGAGEASEQSQTDASTVLSSPAGLATRDKIINEDMSSSDDGRNSLPTGRRGRIAFKMRSDVEVLDDGYRWRKYGKKMVKNSPNPRNYYRCSSEGCNVKKRVERERDDARFVITTYDGVHNHPAVPLPHHRGPISL